MSNFKLDIKSIQSALKNHIGKTVERYIKGYFENIKAGKVIKESYATSTVQRRKRYGLNADRVRLSGSEAYSGKSTRLLTPENYNWKIRGKKILVFAKRTEDRVLWVRLKKKYRAL